MLKPVIVMTHTGWRLILRLKRSVVECSAIEVERAGGYVEFSERSGSREKLRILSTSTLNFGGSQLMSVVVKPVEQVERRSSGTLKNQERERTDSVQRDGSRVLKMLGLNLKRWWAVQDLNL